MKTIGLLLFILVVATTTTRAQDLKKNNETVKPQSSVNEKMPRPLPPKAAQAATAQPLPSESNNTVNERGIIIVSGLPQKKAQSQENDKMLNAQPLHPKADDKANKAQNSGNEKQLNPQPLPPKANIQH